MLATNGIASFRFDKRGIAESQPAMTAERDLRFETYINDVKGWIALLKSDKRFSSIILLGHSEGSLIGMIAATQPEIKGFISISGAGRPADIILKAQLENKLPQQLMDESNKILDSLKAGKTVSAVDPSLIALYRPGVQPYMISWLKYDPAKEISTLKIPVLIIHGSTDLQVSLKDAKLLSVAKPDARLLIIENMNHVFKESDSDVTRNMATYKNPDLPLKPGLVEEITGFIKTIKQSKIKNMEKRTITETIIDLETAALDAWHDGNPTPYLELYSKDFTYFDPVQERRLDGWDRIKELYESMRGKVKMDSFRIINPVVQSTGKMAVLTYNLHSYSGETLWKENCTEVYRLEKNNEWKIIHSHWSFTKPSID
jgi:ketosteroid isomerase-like protein/alpha/beta superfamily hydrolase